MGYRNRIQQRTRTQRRSRGRSQRRTQGRGQQGGRGRTRSQRGGQLIVTPLPTNYLGQGRVPP